MTSGAESIAVKAEGLSKLYRFDHPLPTLKESMYPNWLRRNWLPDGRSFWALKEVSFELKRGQSLGVIGANGSGKTTLLKILASVARPTAGRCVIRGRKHSILRLGTGFHPDLTGRRNLFFYAMLHGFSKAWVAENEESVIEFSGIGEFADVPVKYYSAGMYARLAFSVGVHAKPDVLVLDEIFSVGDALFKLQSEEKIKSMLHEGCSMILVSHELTQIAQTCQDALWLHMGQQAAYGPAAEVCQKYVQECQKAKQTAPAR